MKGNSTITKKLSDQDGYFRRLKPVSVILRDMQYVSLNTNMFTDESEIVCGLSFWLFNQVKKNLSRSKANKYSEKVVIFRKRCKIDKMAAAGREQHDFRWLWETLKVINLL